MYIDLYSDKIKKLDGLQTKVNGITYKVFIGNENDPYDIMIKAANDRSLVHNEWYEVFASSINLNYYTILQILKEYGFNKEHKWIDEQLFDL